MPNTRHLTKLQTTGAQPSVFALQRARIAHLERVLAIQHEDGAPYAQTSPIVGELLVQRAKFSDLRTADPEGYVLWLFNSEG
jgi:hypothetical protein